MKIRSKELNEKKPDIESKNTKIYFLSEQFLIKYFARCGNIEKKYRLKKYEIAKQIRRIEGLILPIDVLETEEGFSGFIEPVIPGTFTGDLTSYAEIINSNPRISLEEIAQYILKCEKIVRSCHANGVVNSDMSSLGNVVYNKKLKQVFFTDYQDMQVRKIPTGVISSFISVDPIIGTRKYSVGEMYTKNIDLYTLTMRFFYYITRINGPRASLSYSVNELLEIAGASATAFGDCMRALYDPNKDNLDIREPIIELCKEYELTPYQKGHPRMLIKK